MTTVDLEKSYIRISGLESTLIHRSAERCTFKFVNKMGKSDLKLMNEIDLSGKNFSSHERVLIFRLKLLGGLATQSAMHEQVYFYTHSDHFRPIVR